MLGEREERGKEREREGEREGKRERSYRGKKIDFET